MAERAHRTIVAFAAALALAAAGCGSDQPSTTPPVAAGDLQTGGVVLPGPESTPDPTGGGGGNGGGGGGTTSHPSSGGQSGSPTQPTSAATNPPTQSTPPAATTPAQSPSPSATPHACLVGEWEHEESRLEMPGAAWGLSGIVTLTYDDRDKSELYLYPDYTYLEFASLYYAGTQGTHVTSVHQLGQARGGYSVSGNTLSFTNSGQLFGWRFSLNGALVASTNAGRWAKNARFSCSQTSLTLSSDNYTASFTRSS